MSEQKTNWITLEHASEISGASVAIIQDTLRRYQNSPETLRSKIENNIYYVDKAQILNLFTSSATPIVKDKMPGTLFRWFDELRQTYEASLASMQKKVEKSQDESRQDLKHQYETRIFELEENYQHQIANLKQAHTEQIKLLKRNILRLEKEVQFYQQQSVNQQKTLDQLNTRYDAIILAMHHNAGEKLKEIDQPALSKQQDTQENQRLTAESKAQQLTKEQTELKEPESKQSEEEITDGEYESVADRQSDIQAPIFTGNPDIQVHHPQHNIDWQIEALLESAFQARQQQEFKLAFELFEQAALLGCNKAMGALARSYFTGEGIDNNIEKAIAWLLLADVYEFEPAAQKLAKIKLDYPAEFSEAQNLLPTLNEQIHLHLEEMTGYTEA